MLSPAASLVVSLCQLQSLASSLPTEIFEGNTGRGPDLVWTTSQSGLSIEAAEGGDWYMATNDFAWSIRSIPHSWAVCSWSSAMRSRTSGAFSQLSAFASAFLALPCYFPIRLRSGFPLGDYQREFLVPGIPENRHRFTAVYRLGPLALRPFFARSFAGRPHRDSEPLKSIWYIGTLWEVSPSP
jgi:hypothetical protein